MNEKELNRLINKFYEGESTEEDEKILRAFFSGDNVPEGFETEKHIFRYFMESGSVTEPSAGFEERIYQAVKSSEQRRLSEKAKSYFLPLLSAAAVILIMAGTYFFFESKRGIKDTYSDPEVAYNEAMKILTDVSTRLNRGRACLEPVAKLGEMTAMSFESLNRSSSMVRKSMNKLNHLEKDLSNINILDTGVINK